jgi:hypothetical protein
MPFLLILFLATADLVLNIMLHNRMERISATISGVVSLQPISRDQLISYMGTTEDIAEPFDFNSNGQMVVSQIRNFGETDNPANMVISWQQSMNGAVSRFGLPGGFPQNLPGDLQIVGDQSVIVAEAFYNYTPLFDINILKPETIYSAGFAVPRMGAMNNLIGETILP